MSQFFKDKTVLITGASSGLGEAFARELARRGAHVILTARSRDKLETLAKELRESFQMRSYVIAADLTEKQAPQKIYETVNSLHLQVDLLINNAGLGFFGKFAEIPFEKTDQVLQVNMHALVALTDLFLPPMLNRKRGGILNVASTAGYQPLPKLGVYAATKAFVLSFTEALWGEYRHSGVRIFCLSPGNTLTDFHSRAAIPKRHVFFSATPEEVVRFGLRMFEKTDRPSAVYGPLNRILALGHRIFPRRFVIGAASLLYR